MTAASVAFRKSDEIRALLELGANVNLKDKNGKTALDLMPELKEMLAQPKPTGKKQNR